MPYPRIKLQDSDSGLISQPDEVYNSNGQHSRSDDQEALTNSLGVLVERTVGINQASAPIPDAFGFPPLNKRQETQSELKRKSMTNWRFLIPKPKLFTTPSSLDVQKSVASHNRRSPSTGPAKILFLGSSTTGKSTFLKSISRAREKCWSLDTRLSFKEVIFSNAVQSMRVILEAMESLEMMVEDLKNEYHVQTIFMQSAQIEADSLPPEVCRAIEALWEDSGVKRAFERSREYQLNDSAA
jgi:G-protein alpha subunit